MSARIGEHKFFFTGKYGKRAKVTIALEVRLEEKENCTPYLDIDLQPCERYIGFTSGVGIKGYSYGESWGRVDAELAEMVPSKADALRKLAAFSKRWHLNGLQAGTRRQREVLQLPESRERIKAEPLAHYAVCCAILKEHALYECGSYYPYPEGRVCPACKGEGVVGGEYPMPCIVCKGEGHEPPTPRPYRYGTAWLAEPLPESALNEMQAILAELEQNDG